MARALQTRAPALLCFHAASPLSQAARLSFHTCLDPACPPQVTSRLSLVLCHSPILIRHGTCRVCLTWRARLPPMRHLVLLCLPLRHSLSALRFHTRPRSVLQHLPSLRLLPRLRPLGSLPQIPTGPSPQQALSLFWPLPRPEAKLVCRLSTCPVGFCPCASSAIPCLNLYTCLDLALPSALLRFAICSPDAAGPARVRAWAGPARAGGLLVSFPSCRPCVCALSGSFQLCLMRLCLIRQNHVWWAPCLTL